MRIKASIVTKSVLALLIAAGISACNQNKRDSKPAAATTASTTTGTPEIVYINQDSLIAKYDYIKDMNNRLTDKGKAAQADVQSRQQAIQLRMYDGNRRQIQLLRQPFGQRFGLNAETHE